VKNAMKKRRSERILLSRARQKRGLYPFKGEPEWGGIVPDKKVQKGRNFIGTNNRAKVDRGNVRKALSASGVACWSKGPKRKDQTRLMPRATGGQKH